MCGFSGIFRWDSNPVDKALLQKMTSTLIHRGPDDEGYYYSENKDSKVKAGLGFRRLSIIDLSGGHQPMTTIDKRNWIVFNGEIYNFPELRKELENRGRRFLTRSDTEVILHLYEIYGTDCVQHLRGMFAFAIWDSVKRTVFLARDRIGKKPLFYAKTDRALFFASEMKAILQSDEISRKINLDAIPLYLAYQFIPSPITIFENVQRLPPAHTLTCNENGEINVQGYWKIARRPQSFMSEEETAEEFRRQLKEATKIRLISDVPLGAFLSGGLDSSAVVGMMSEQMSEPVKTFSIGFEESDFSELEYARIIAKRFGTDHHEFVVKPEMIDLLPKLAWHYDQPFADPSALPSYYVARETRKFVTVALNGDGGDENFGGYRRYQADYIFSAVSKMPRPLRSVMANMLLKIPNQWQKNGWLRNMVRAGRNFGVSSTYEYNYKNFCYFDDQAQKQIFEDSAFSEKASVYDYFASLYNQTDSEEVMDRILNCDALGYLPDCLLVKMDIASMSNSLETRSPFLDHKLMEFAGRLPVKYKVKFNGGKWIVKRALRNFLPESILYRRKMGFGIPLSNWFRGTLKNFLRETLLSTQAKQRGFFKVREVERLVNEHQNGIRDHGYKLWALLMFELWNQVYVDRNARPVEGIKT